MLESKAYQTYYAFASGEKAQKPKYIRKKADSDTSPKKKHVQATKAEQIKLATKRSKKGFHVSHASGSGDGVNTQSKVPDEQQQKTSGTDEGTGTIPRVPDVPPYESKSDRESWGDSEDEDENDDDEDNDDDRESDDHYDGSDDERTETDSDEILDPNLTNVDQTEYEEEDVDDRVRTPLDYEPTIDEKLDDETMDDEEDDEVIKELYDDVNVKLGNDDTKMTDAYQGASEQQNVSQELWFEQEEEDAHVTLTPVLDTQKADEPVQSSFITSLMDTTTQYASVIPKITSRFTTTIPPPPPFLHPLQQETTPAPTPPTFTTTTSTNPTVTLPEIPNFASVFKFDQRVSALESEMSELRQTNQFTEAISSIPRIVDTYLASKMKEAVDVAVQLQTNKLKEEAQAKNQ
ncbi:hypothetical protein Tco_0772232 [Tanacetum coccineum]|uniref:Uncharacterized protein n=1 Tax=Tanacetum coccineum TaxID=301880 RepID=A0ABQ4ZJW5_9ASTR